MERLLVSVPITALLVAGLAAPADSAKMSRKDVAEAFILAMKAKKREVAKSYVDAIGPGGVKAVLKRPDYVYNGKSSWDPVTGADCQGIICRAEGFPATPEPAWYVVKRKGQYRVVARAYLDTADYLLDQGTFGCLTRKRKVQNRVTKWNLVRKVPAGTPVWYATDAAEVNVAVDIGKKPRTKFIFGHIPYVQNHISYTCGG